MERLGDARALPRARRRFGQHFLEAAWIAKVIDAFEPQETDHVLEIGPGRGALTLPLAPKVAQLLAVEVDRDLAAALRARAPTNVDVVCGDFLDIGSQVVTGLGTPVRVIGNLPYNISSPILVALIDLAGATDRLVDATLMLQREVAERVAAPPGSKTYGTLSVLATLAADVTWLLDVPPGAFRPAPKVHSAVVKLTFRTGGAAALPAGFGAFIKRVFGQRRKTLANALRSAASHVPARQLSAVLDTLGLPATTRPEMVAADDFLRLYAHLKDITG